MYLRSLVIPLGALFLTACGGGGSTPANSDQTASTSSASNETTSTETTSTETTSTTSSSVPSGSDAQCIQEQIASNGMVAKAGDDISILEGYSVNTNSKNNFLIKNGGKK